MKKWEYYSTPDVPFFTLQEEVKYKVSLERKIESSYLNVVQRRKALAKVNSDTAEYTEKKRKPYYDARYQLRKEFWQDARKELGYGQWLHESVVKALEEKVERDSRCCDSHDYGCLFEELKIMVKFVEMIAEGISPAQFIIKKVTAQT